MKQIVLIFIVLLSISANSQEVNESNFNSVLSGKWTLNFCNSEWEVQDWVCVDTLTFHSDGLVESFRTCEKPEDYPDDIPFDPIMKTKMIWTRFDKDKMIIYSKFFEEWNNSFSDERKRYDVVSISKDELKVTAIAAAGEGSSEKEILYVLYQRVK